MQNKAQYEYDLDRKAGKISALSSNTFNKYDYLTGEDLGFKSSTVEQAKFEYSPLGKIFTKGLDEDDQKEGLFKSLENIEGKNEAQLQAIEDQGKKTIGCNQKHQHTFKTAKDNWFFSTISEKAKKAIGEH